MATVTRDQKKFILSQLNSISQYGICRDDPLPSSIKRARRIVDNYIDRQQKRKQRAYEAFNAQRAAVIRALHFGSAQDVLKKLDAFMKKYSKNGRR